MSYDQHLRNQLWAQELKYERNVIERIDNGEICQYCHDELDEGRPCLNCKAAEHLKALLTDAMSVLGVEPSVAHVIVNQLRHDSDRNFYSSRKLAAMELRLRRLRYR